MDFSLLLSSYATVWSNPEVLLMTFIGALGGVLLGAIPGMTATMGVALLIPFSFGMDLIPSSTPPARPPQPPPCWTATPCARRVRPARPCPSPCSRPSAAASSAHWS